MKPWHRMVLSGSVASDQGQTALAVLPRTAATDPLSTTSSTREPQAVRDAPVAQPDSTFPVSQAVRGEPASLVDSTRLLSEREETRRPLVHGASRSENSLTSVTGCPPCRSLTSPGGLLPPIAGRRDSYRKRVVL